MKTETFTCWTLKGRSDIDFRDQGTVIQSITEDNKKSVILAYNLSQVLLNEHIDIYKIKTYHDTENTTADGQEPSSIHFLLCAVSTKTSHLH